MDPDRTPDDDGADGSALLRLYDATIAHYTPDLILSASTEGKITSLNPAFERLTGFSRADWLGRSFCDLVHPDDRDLAQATFERVLRRERPPLVEVRLVTSSGALVSVEGATIPQLHHGEVVGVLGICRETTALRVHARQQSAIAYLGGRAFAMVDATAFTREAVEIVAETLGVPHCRFLEARDAVAARELVPRASHGEDALPSRGRVDDPHAAFALASNETIVVDDFRLERRFDATMLAGAGRASGIATPVAGRRHPFGVLTAHTDGPRRFSQNDVHFFQAIANHIGWAILRHQEEMARRQLLVRLFSMQDDERTHIARELHDDVGQLVTGLKLGLEAEEKQRASGATPNPARLLEMKRIASVLLERVRDLSTSLRPPMLDELGLVPALEWHFERYTVQTGVRVAFTHAGVDRGGDADLEAGVFRIVQEALTNVARHAGVAEVAVRLVSNADELRVEIEDHGRGFDPSSIGASSSGLTGASERALALGGTLSVDAAPAGGVTLVAKMPRRQASVKDPSWKQTSPSSSPTITR